ncbi:MAG: GNAT family N-acetyltransferase [Eubacterium sp.]|nr:GNAT family N-acetyltransferase [Eubacterium sp.]
MDWIIKKFDELSPKEIYEILRSRGEIFVKEQKICCTDPDGVDYESVHFFCMNEGRVSAYLRAFQYDENTVKIGRVLTLVHRNGLGSELMKTAIKKIPEIFNCEKIYVAAQKQAIPFYEHCGFTVTSGEYLEEGIPHHDMILKIQN